MPLCDAYGAEQVQSLGQNVLAITTAPECRCQGFVALTFSIQTNLWPKRRAVQDPLDEDGVLVFLGKEMQSPLVPYVTIPLPCG